MAEAMPSDEELLAELQTLLKGADLATTTERMLREKLEEKFNVPLKSKKGMIREQVNKYLSEQNGDAEEGDEDGEEDNGDEDDAHEGRSTRPKKTQKKKRQSTTESDDKPAPKRRSTTKSSAILSPELQAFLGEESLPRPQIVKRLWAYIKEHNLQNPNDKRAILCDDTLKTLFTPPVNMFSINKQLSRHIKSG